MTAVIQRIKSAFYRLDRYFGMQDYILLFLRVWVAKIFYLSGRSKVEDGFLSPSDMTVMLFEEEYALPILDPGVAAHMALYAETFFPIMLLLGIGARFAAIGLLGMTLVIQFLVYPSYFPEHATWLAALLPIIMMGAGAISGDRLLGSVTSGR